MPTILHRLPFLEAPTAVSVPDGIASVKSYQIIVWASLSGLEILELRPHAPRFPVILDTGTTQSFAIQQRHLVSWAGVRPETLRTIGTARISGQRVPLVAVTVWLHRNQPGYRDAFTARPAFPLDMREGVVVYPGTLTSAPRLPLLGLRALAKNNLHLTIDGQRRHVSLRTPRRFWFFG